MRDGGTEFVVKAYVLLIANRLSDEDIKMAAPLELITPISHGIDIVHWIVFIGKVSIKSDWKAKCCDSYIENMYTYEINVSLAPN